MKKKNPHSVSVSYSSRNYQMCILSLIAICFVVLGHIRFGIMDKTEAGTFYGWFPYYSFHLPVFLFITGYFFKDPISFSDASLRRGSGKDVHTCASGNFGQGLEAIGRFILHKARTLLLPFFILTGLFLLAGTLLTVWGFTWPDVFSWQTFLFAPWTRLYTLTLGVPLWYLFALFLAEIYFVLLRTLLGYFIRRPLLMEILCLLLCLAMGVAALSVNSLPGVTQTASVYLRSVLMLFFIQAGVLYRRHLEKHDTLGSIPYFLIIFLIQLLIIIASRNSILSPGLYGLVGFEAFGYDYFLAGLTGVALYLRISRLLSSIPGRSRLVLFAGSNTLYIMAFHITGFFLLNALFSLIKNAAPLSVFLRDFQTARWHAYLYYTLTEDPRMIPLYLISGVGISLLIAWILRTSRSALSRPGK